MVIYKCLICNFSSKLKTDYKRHLNTKKHKNNVIAEGIKSQKEPEKSQKEPVKKKHICPHCGELFSTFSHKRRHELHRCKMSPYVEEKKSEEKEKIKKELDQENKILVRLDKEKNKQIEKLEKRVDRLTKRIGNTTNILHNNNSCLTNNNNNTIKINSYGKEDISHITDDFKTELLKGPYGAIPKMIEAIHFNDEKPENKNVVIPNINKNIIKVLEDDKWKFKNKALLLYDMIDSNYLILDDHYDLIVHGKKLTHHNKENYIDFRVKYDNGNKKLFSDLKSECEIMMMNKR